MKLKRFEDLECWQLAREYVKSIYELIHNPKFAKDFRLVAQITGAGISVMNNIVEGWASQSTPEFIRFLKYSRRSCAESQNCLYIAIDQNYITEIQFKETYNMAIRVIQVTDGFLHYLRDFNRKSKNVQGKINVTNDINDLNERNSTQINKERSNMDIFDVIKERRSVRAYTDEPVEKEKLDKIFEAVRLAPSAANYQEWRFVVVTGKSKREELMVAANNQKFVAEVPVVIACCAETDGHKMRCGEACYPIDVAIAIDHITLAAVALGLGTCWIGSFYPDQVKKILNIPPEIRVVELLTLGYPADSSRPKDRKSVEEIVHYEEW